MFVMRLTPCQQTQIREIVVRHAGSAACVRVFGSRLDDHRQGGDIDLLIDCPRPLSPWERAQLQNELQSTLGIAVDLTFHVHGRPWTAFQQIAAARSVVL